MANSLGLLSGVLALCSFIPYIYSIVRGRTRPSCVSWCTWSVVQVILTATFWYSTENQQIIWVSVSYTFAAIVVAVLSLKYGEFGRTDKVVVCGIGLALVLWVFTSAQQALVIIVIIDALASWPTIKKSNNDPDSEDLTAWLMGFTANCLNLAAIHNWNEIAILYPLYLFAMTGTIAFLLVYRKAN